MHLPPRVALSAAAFVLASAVAGAAAAGGVAGGAAGRGPSLDGTSPRPGAARTLSDLESVASSQLRRAWAPGGRRDAAGDAEEPATFTGLDGQQHVESDPAVRGADGYLYAGEDFDTACAFGAHLRTSLRSMSRLADILEKHGRRVLFTVAPNKAVVVRDELPRPLPQGACGRRGMKIQARDLDRYRDPRYLPLRRALATTPHSYWRTDSHWTTVGASVFAEHLAEALGPRLAGLQRYRSTVRTHRGDLAEYVPGVTDETNRARVPDNGVRTRPAGDSPAYDPSLHSVYTELKWSSRPASKTYGGRTLVLGDSFSYVATESLSNLFRHGHFMWVGFQPVEDVARAVAHADTVVFAVVQRYATIHPLADRAWQNELRAALRHQR